MSTPSSPSFQTPRYCLGCGYMLNHLDRPSCPECGRAYDPSDPASYTYREDRNQAPVWLTSIIVVALSYPLFGLLILHTCWLIACAMLGRRPVHGDYIDHVLVLAPGQLFVLLLQVYLLAFIFSVVSVLTVVVLAVFKQPIGKCVWLSVLVVIVWFGTGCYVYWDPFYAFGGVLDLIID